MEEPVKTTSEMSAKTANQRNSWLKRLGFAGVLFFLIKGLLWIIIPVLVARGCL